VTGFIGADVADRTRKKLEGFVRVELAALREILRSGDNTQVPRNMKATNNVPAPCFAM
jgi:hypothetical protein